MIVWLINKFTRTLAQRQLWLEFFGYIRSDGSPRKCVCCGSKVFERYREWYGSHGVEEYTLVCSRCQKVNGHWAYGYWTPQSK